MDMEYKDRIKIARAHAGLTQGQLADAVGVKQASISDLETGKSQSSSYSASIAKACGVDALWLEKGQGAMVNKKTDEAKSSVSYPKEEDYALIRQYSAVGECGNGYLNDHVELSDGLAFKRDWLARIGAKAENLAVIYAAGDSMEPYIFDGDVVLFDTSDTEPKHGQVYVVRRPDDSVSIKRLVQQLAGDWVIKSDNPDRTDEKVSSDTIHEIPFVGRVIWRGGNIS